LPDRHLREHVIDQVGGGLGHAPDGAGGADAALQKAAQIMVLRYETTADIRGIWDNNGGN
jgi:hypothetical protein